MKKFLSKCWSSPTLTSWGNYAAQSLRLFLITPLLLTRFDETQIAAWFMFASLGFFGTTIASRFVLSFSRMFAFAMAGQDDLSTIRNARGRPEGHGKPCWGVFADAYGALGILLLLVASLNLLIAFGMGLYGLGNLLEDYRSPLELWWCFAIITVSQFISICFKRYTAALVGMNYVAVNARWGMIMSLLSVSLGAIALTCNASLLVLAIVMQSIVLLVPLRMYLLLRRIEGGRVSRMKTIVWNTQVLKWACGPTVKGFITDLSITGVTQLVCVLYTGIGTDSQVAALLFSVRMAEFAGIMAIVPFTSVQPVMSKLLAAGKTVQLSSIIKQRVLVSVSLFAFAMIAGAILLPFLLDLIDSNIGLLPVDLWLLYGALLVCLRFIYLSLTVVALGNDYPLWVSSLMIIFVAGLGVLVLGDEWGVCGPMFCMTLPSLFIYGLRPMKLARDRLNVCISQLYSKHVVTALAAYLLIGCSIIYS